jgi:2-dehydropantoate 2-reductase
MKTAILGAGAMGSVIGSFLVEAEGDVVLIDVAKPVVDAISSRGLLVRDKAGNQKFVRIAATTEPGSVGLVDLLIVFVKCYHTEVAVRSALPLIGDGSIVLSLQNGWGNAPRISKLVGPEKLLVGVSYHSATVLGPGQVFHSGQGPTYLGELDGSLSERAKKVASFLSSSGLQVQASAEVLKEIWSKLALNVVTLPTSVLARLTADKLLNSTDMQELMQNLLREVIAVVNAQKIAMNFDERWRAITGLLNQLAPNTKGSMLQDVELQRPTEIDVINGAIVEAGLTHKIPTPYNHAVVSLVKALETGLTLESLKSKTGCR